MTRINELIKKIKEYQSEINRVDKEILKCRNNYQYAKLGKERLNLIKNLKFVSEDLTSFLETCIDLENQLN